MIETLERAIRDIYVEDADSYDTTAAAERLLAINYGPRSSRRRRLWAAVGASGTLLAGAAIALILLLSSGASTAYAGWTAVPTVATAAAVATATAACNKSGADELTGRPVLTDARGIYTAAIYVSGDTTWFCISDGHTDDSSLSMNLLVLKFYAAPGPDQLGLPAGGGGSAKGFGHPSPGQLKASLKNLPNSVAYRDSVLRRGVETQLAGRAGRDVSAVQFVFADGSKVDATIQNGWYFAWWPALDYPSSVQVTAGSKTRTSPMPSAKCQSGSDRCAFAGIGHGLTGAPNG